jgi:hypothetical protein
MPDSHLSRRSEALQGSKLRVLSLQKRYQQCHAAREAMNTSACLVWICALRREDNSPFFSIVHQLGNTALHNIGEQWRQVDSIIQSTLEINGKDWKQNAQNFSNYFHSAAELSATRWERRYGLKRSVRVQAFTCPC